MKLSQRTRYEIGGILGVIGICVVIMSAARFDAFLDSDQRYKNEFEPYLITHALRNPETSEDNLQMFLHRAMIYDFYPSGSQYSRCGQLVVCGSSGLVIVALGALICLRARKRPIETS